MNSRTNLRQFVAHLCGWSSAATLRHTPTSGSLCQLIILCSPLCIASQIDTQPALVVVVVVNILLQIKRTTLMIGHCTALAVIVTKTLAGKLSEPKQDKEAKLTTPHVLV
jgi:hypothetical protein